MSKKLLKTLKNTVIVLASPVLVYVFFKLVCNSIGADGFGVGTDFINIISNTIFTGMIALALGYNLTSGRLDFSIGSVIILTAIIAGNVAIDYDFVGLFGETLAPVMMLLVSALVGAICGLVSGLLYIWLRVPPMILALGITMIYEGIGYWFNNSRGVKLQGRGALLEIGKLPNNIILVIAVLAVLVFLLSFTKFGYNKNALRSDQAIAVNVGINEKKNAVICYVISGVLLGIAAILYVSQYGQMAPKTGLASSSFLMGAFLPIFIGGALSKYTDENIGVIIGAFIQATIISGFNFLGFGTQLQNVLNGVIVMLFLIYTSNRYKLVEIKMFKEKALLAKKNREADCKKAQ